jgi:response regulator RpfG family c-di-GMP phosphodiesterase
MAQKHPIIFLLEDCPTTGLLVERAVMHEMPEVRLMWALSVEEATARAEGMQIDLFLVDVNLPDGNGLDFIWNMSIEHPNARAIVMTATPLPEHPALTAALGVLHFLEKPLKIPSFISQLRDALEIVDQDDENSDFQATLKNVTPADVLQLKCLTAATTVVEFISGQSVGRIRFEDGEIVDATVGGLQGVDAVYEIVGWKRGQVIEHSCVGFTQRTIECSWQTLLMDAAHRLDERRSVAAA